MDGDIKILRKRLFVQNVENDFKVPVYKALEKRWNHWDDLENDPRYLYKQHFISNKESKLYDFPGGTLTVFSFRQPPHRWLGLEVYQTISKSRK